MQIKSTPSSIYFFIFFRWGGGSTINIRFEVPEVLFLFSRMKTILLSPRNDEEEK